MRGNDFDNVPHNFQISVAQNSNSIAIRTATERLSYAELDARAEALRDLLVSAGVQQGTLVGIFLDRSVSAITSFLAVMKAGGAFVLLDPGSPPQNILDIV